jgi:hypothetical protein
LRSDTTLFPRFRRLNAHVVATFTRLTSSSWRTRIRRKGKYLNETFLRRKHAEESALDIERRIDRQEPATTRSRDAKLVGDLISLHRAELEEVGKKVGRRKMPA